MSQALPVDGFRWLEKEEFEHLNINYVSDDSEDGYILDVDLDYPSELHDHHNEYLLVPEKMKVTEDMLSPYAKQLLEELELKGTSTEKLISHLHSKEKYVVHRTVHLSYMNQIRSYNHQLCNIIDSLHSTINGIFRRWH